MSKDINNCTKMPFVTCKTGTEPSVGAVDAAIMNLQVHFKWEAVEYAWFACMICSIYIKMVEKGNKDMFVYL